MFKLSDNSILNKLILLFIIDKMEIPLTENSLIDIATSRNNWLNYMDYKDVLHQLLDARFIYKIVDDSSESRYNITYEGRECISHFFNRIPSSLREQISEFAKNNRMHFKRAQEYTSDYFKNSDGSYTCLLRIREPLDPQNLFEIKIKTSSRETAIKMVKKWKDKAASIYENINEVLDS